MDMDMIPPRDRSIRNIPVPPRPGEIPQDQHEQPLATSPMQTPPPTRHSRRNWFILGGVIAICIVAGVLLSTIFEKSTITLTPHEADVTPTGPVNAVPTADQGSLVYQTFSMTRSASTTSTVSGTQKVSKFASGVITIYNTYSAQPQKLIANTRFSSPDGLIYRIHSAVTIPGETTAGGKAAAGQVTATVYADQPGDSYNIADSVRFSIPGFRGDPRYNTFYGQSQGPIAGGFVGMQPVISSADLSAASKVLKQTLQSSIEAATGASSIPDGFLVVPGSLQIAYSDIAQSPAGTGSVQLSQSGTARVAMVRINDLAAAVAKQMVQGYSGEAVAFKNPAVSITSSTSSTPGAVGINVAGPVTLVWQINPDDVKKAVIGKPKSSFESIIKAFGASIETAQAKVRPFWERSFPSDPNKIDVVVNS